MLHASAKGARKRVSACRRTERKFARGARTSIYCKEKRGAEIGLETGMWETEWVSELWLGGGYKMGLVVGKIL